VKRSMYIIAYSTQIGSILCNFATAYILKKNKSMLQRSMYAILSSAQLWYHNVQNKYSRN